MFQLIAEGTEERQRWRMSLAPGRSYELGRDPQSDLPVPWDILISGRHLRVKATTDVVEIEKLPFQHDLANMAGTSRETISRTLHSFAKKGLIELEGSKLRITNYETFKDLFS